MVAQSVKNLPAMRETWVLFLGQEDPLEKEMATHSSIFAWRIPWTEEPGRFPVPKVIRVGHNLATKPPDMVPVLMYWCGSWTIKKTECQRIDVFGLWC